MSRLKTNALGRVTVGCRRTSLRAENTFEDGGRAHHREPDRSSLRSAGSGGTGGTRATTGAKRSGSRTRPTAADTAFLSALASPEGIITPDAASAFVRGLLPAPLFDFPSPYHRARFREESLLAGLSEPTADQVLALAEGSSDAHPIQLSHLPSSKLLLPRWFDLNSLSFYPDDQDRSRATLDDDRQYRSSTTFSDAQSNLLVFRYEPGKAKDGSADRYWAELVRFYETEPAVKIDPGMETTAAEALLLIHQAHRAFHSGGAYTMSNLGIMEPLIPILDRVFGGVRLNVGSPIPEWVDLTRLELDEDREGTRDCFYMRSPGGVELLYGALSVEDVQEGKPTNPGVLRARYTRPDERATPPFHQVQSTEALQLRRAVQLAATRCYGVSANLRIDECVHSGVQVSKMIVAGFLRAWMVRPGIGPS